MKHTKLVALAGTAALALTLSACGDGGEAPTIPTAPGGDTQTSPEESSPVEPTSPEETSPVEPTSPEETSPVEPTSPDETSPEESPDTGGGEPIPTGDVSIFNVVPPVCTTFELLNSHPDNSQESGMTTIPGVDCNGPHDIEFFHTEVLPDGDFPGDDGIATTATEACGGRFEEYVGTPYMESALDWDYVGPNQTTWDSGDRELLCIIYHPMDVPSGPFQGSGM